MARPKPKSRGVIPDGVEIELPERYHAEGCPMDEERLDWETYVPSTGDHAGEEVALIRCVQCGGERHTPLADLLAAVE